MRLDAEKDLVCLAVRLIFDIPAISRVILGKNTGAASLPRSLIFKSVAYLTAL